MGATESSQPNNKAQNETKSFKCNSCGNKFNNQHRFMMHKKELHIDTVATCEQFLSGKCLKTHDECWYKHPKLKKLMEIVSNLCQKVENVEMKMSSMMKQ